MGRGFIPLACLKLESNEHLGNTDIFQEEKLVSLLITRGEKSFLAGGFYRWGAQHRSHHPIPTDGGEVNFNPPPSITCHEVSNTENSPK